MERGGVWEGGGRKRALKALEKWPLALKASPGGLGKIRPQKRLLETLNGTEQKARKTPRIEGRKPGMLEKWIQREAKGSEDQPRPLRRKISAEKEPEPSGKEGEKGMSQPAPKGQKI